MSRVVHIADEAEMMALGGELARACRPPCAIHLRGELGVGKTTLARGFLRALGHRGVVKSPTYTLMEPYAAAGRRIWHCDLYRVEDPEELEMIGLRDCFTRDAILLVEWPERGAGLLPAPDVTILLRVVAGAPTEREAEIRGIVDPSGRADGDRTAETE